MFRKSESGAQFSERPATALIESLEVRRLLAVHPMIEAQSALAIGNEHSSLSYEIHTAGINEAPSDLAPAGPPVIFADSFEDGLLDGWKLGGRLQGSYLTEVVDRHGSKMGHVQHSEFTEADLGVTVPYSPDLLFEFDMETSVAGGPGGNSSYYVDAGAMFTFRDASGAWLADVAYVSATSTYPFQSPNCVSVGSALDRYSIAMSELAGLHGLPAGQIATITLNFHAYSSAWGSMNSDVWFDDVVITSGPSVPENAPAGTVVDTIITTDPDLGDTFTYSLVSGVGSEDNGRFAIVGDELRTRLLLNYEEKRSYSIRVRTTDAGGLWYEEALRVSATDVPEVAVPWAITGTEGADTVSLVNLGNEYRLRLNGSTSYRVVDLVSSVTLDLLAGDDAVTIGGATAVTLIGGDGDDTLRGGNGADEIRGGLGDDSIVGMDGADTIYAAAGNDTVYSGMGADRVQLGVGDDAVRSGAHDDSVWAGAGRDTVIGDNGADLLYGDEDNDTVNGGDGDDTIYGAAGSDWLIGVGGDDLIYGGVGADQLMGGYDQDTLFGEAGDDILRGGAGNDKLDGGASTDTVLGEAGDDWIHSGGDDMGDVVRGDAGVDRLVCDALDTFLDMFEDSALA